MKHKCDNCDYKYISSTSIGACLYVNNLKEAQEAYNADKCPFATPKITNFDRIKAMSVEEMADFLLEVHSDGWVMGANDDLEDPLYNKEWLESEVQGE